jgi:uncharacterized C2H2 Zn-finger protein
MNLLCEAISLLEIQNASIVEELKNKKRIKERGPVKYIKNEDDKFMCPDCSYTAKNSSTMSMHYSKKHTENNKNHKCKECDIAFVHSTGLRQHVARAHSPAQILCQDPNCKEVFKMQIDSQKHYVRLHMNDVHTHTKLEQKDKYVCVTCSIVYNSHNIQAHVSRCHPCSPFIKK